MNQAAFADKPKNFKQFGLPTSTSPVVRGRR